MAFEKRHECIGGCGTMMAYPGDRCGPCKKHIETLAPVWKEASENINTISILNEAHKGPVVPKRSKVTKSRGEPKPEGAASQGRSQPPFPQPTPQPVHRGSTQPDNRDQCPTCGERRMRGNRYCALHAGR